VPLVALDRKRMTESAAIFLSTLADRAHKIVQSLNADGFAP